MLHENITRQILSAYYQVYNRLGFGFLEKNYENAMLIELRSMGLKCCSQQPITVYYKDQIIGEYFSDIVVEDKVIIELKAASAIAPQFELQLLNYLRATKMEVGLLLNFGESASFKRKVFSNDKKHS